MTVRAILRKDYPQGFFRLLRIVWVRGTVGIPDGGYSAKLTLAVWPKLVGWERLCSTDWSLTLLGLRIHYSRSYGGIFAS